MTNTTAYTRTDDLAAACVYAIRVLKDRPQTQRHIHSYITQIWAICDRPMVDLIEVERDVCRAFGIAFTDQ
jgi:hypothetical protein